MTRTTHSFARLVALSAALLPCFSATASTQNSGVPHVAGQARPAGLLRAADGSWQADGAGYRARFDGDGAAIWVGQADLRAAAPLSLRLCDWRRGVAAAATERVASEVRGTSMLVYGHDGIAERYAIRTDGFEQSFVLADPLPGSGDLVLGIAVAGTAVANAVAGAHQALEFRSPDGDAIRYGAAVAFERGGTPIEVGTRYDGHGRIELIVPAAFLEHANYPVIIDPAVGPVMSPGGPYYNDSQPDVAFEEESGHYLAVWTRTWSTGLTDLRGQLYDLDGDPVGSMLGITGNGQSREPSVAPSHIWGGRGFAVAYERGDRIRLAYFRSSNGNVALAPIDIGTPPVGARDRRPAVSGRTSYGTGVQVAWDRTPAGGNDPNQIVTAHVYAINAAATLVCEDEFVLDTAASGFVRNVRMPQNLLLQQSAGGSSVNWQVSRAVWERYYPSPSPGDFDVRTMLFRARRFNDFEVLNGPQSVVGASSIGVDENQPAIAVHTGAFYTYGAQANYLIAWTDDEDIVAHRYGLNGPVGSAIEVRATNDIESEPAVAAGATDFSVGYFQSTPPNEFARNVRAARVLLDGTVAIDNREVDVLNGPFQDRLRAASQPLPVLAGAARRNTVMFGWRGATGSGSGTNKVRLRLFEPVAGSTSLFGNSCPGPMGEQPSIGTDGGYPNPGNLGFQLTLDFAPPTTVAALVISDQFTSTPIPGAPGCVLYAGAPFLALYPALVDASGRASVPFPVPVSIPSGSGLAFQWAISTPGWNPFGWIVSNDLDINWSHF